MSLKDEAKAAEASLRKAIKDSEQLGWLTVMGRYNSEIRSNLQLARADVERLTNENKSCKDRAIGAEAKLEGLQTTIESLKQQLERAISRPTVIVAGSRVARQYRHYILVPDNGQQKASMIYSRCADEVWIRAELLCLRDRIFAMPEAGPHKPLRATYDIDPSYPFKEFIKSYAKRPDDRAKLQKYHDDLLQTPTLWNFQLVGD